MVFTKLYFLPVLVSAVWFGISGGIAAALFSTSLYGLHLWYVWASLPKDVLDHVGEGISLIVLGTITGLLVSHERKARTRAQREHLRGERIKIATAVATLTETLAARDPDTGEHSHRVAHITSAFGNSLGLSRPEVRSLYLAGLLHDIGKVGIPDDILLKTEGLSADERRKIMNHPGIGEKILAPIGFSKVVEYIAAHHENVDGSGYPKGLKAEEIPQPAKLLAIVDTYDALRSSRTYKASLSYGEIREIMWGMGGKKLDAVLLDKFWLFIETQPIEADLGARPGDSPDSP